MCIEIYAQQRKLLRFSHLLWCTKNLKVQTNIFQLISVNVTHRDISSVKTKENTMSLITEWIAYKTN